jgi:hypothetical protein
MSRQMYGHGREVALSLLIAAWGCFSSPRLASGQAYPLKTSANGRYLVDQRNRPYLIAGDDAVVTAVAQGIRDADPRHLHTVELD